MRSLLKDDDDPKLFKGMIKRFVKKYGEESLNQIKKELANSQTQTQTNNQKNTNTVSRGSSFYEYNLDPSSNPNLDSSSNPNLKPEQPFYSSVAP